MKASAIGVQRPKCDVMQIVPRSRIFAGGAAFVAYDALVSWFTVSPMVICAIVSALFSLDFHGSTYFEARPGRAVCITFIARWAIASGRQGCG
jgi:hypothetical protein